MGAEAMEIVAPDPHVHGEALCDFVGEAFLSVTAIERFSDFCRRGYILGSHYDWNVSRIGVLGGRIVTHWGVWDYRMRIGRARVRVGGIGAVATHKDYRKQGLMVRTATASLDAMRRAGYDLSILFGISDFYHRFGYVRAWSDTTYAVCIDNLPPERPAGRLRNFKPLARNDLDRLYNHENARRTGTALRPTYPRCMYPEPMEGCRWADARGRTAGYVVCVRRKERLECVDAAGDVDKTLRVLAMLARRCGLREIRFSTFSDTSPLIRRLRRGNCRAETQYCRSGGPMVTTIGLAGVLEKMSGELAARLRASPWAGWRGRLLVADGRDAVTLAVGRKGIHIGAPEKTTHVLRGGDEIAQLLIGAGDPDEIIEDAGIRTRGDGRKVARILFPNEHPQLSQRDRF